MPDDTDTLTLFVTCGTPFKTIVQGIEVTIVCTEKAPSRWIPPDPPEAGLGHVAFVVAPAIGELDIDRAVEQYLVDDLPVAFEQLAGPEPVDG
jgi:hypothetical protein